MSRALIGFGGALAVLLVGHELALRNLIEHEIAGALLAGGAEPPTILAAAATLLLRLLTFGAVAASPALLIYGLAASRPGRRKIRA